jgi:type VI secretion system protein VasG
MDRRLLFRRLAPDARRALEDAAVLAQAAGNPSVEIEHVLAKLLEAPSAALDGVLRALGIEQPRLIRDLAAALERLPRNAGRLPTLGRAVSDLVREGWLLASVDFEADAVEPAHLVLALLADDDLRQMAEQVSREFLRITSAGLEAGRAAAPRPAVPAAAAADAASPAASGAAPVAPHGDKDSLGRFTIDLTGRARAGQLDPVLGRDPEIRQVIDILSRRRQNNPILTGEAGVGKTAVVEGLALKVAAGDVPPGLAGVSIRAVDLALLQAGAGVRGEFEARVKSVVEAVKSSAQPIILFIDEAHMLVGAGGAGQADAANLLKPALARGELRTIAATTWAEYKQYLERDAALARRFQVVRIAEPNEAAATDMLRGLHGALERHHRVSILDEAVCQAVRLSGRYLQGRQLPDKAVSLLDTAAARVRLSQTSTPGALEDARYRSARLAAAAKLLEREQDLGHAPGERLVRLRADGSAVTAEAAALDERWQQERLAATRVQELGAELRKAAEAGAPASEARRAELSEARAALAALQGADPLVHAVVDGQAVAEVLAEWTGIPVGRMLADEAAAIRDFEAALRRRIIGQDHALNVLGREIRKARARLGPPEKPLGCFLLVGPSGVGKTETALAIAEQIFGSKEGLTVLNMSEFKEEHRISTLTGSPPGYVGYGAGGVLTEAVRRRPYGVLLLDEIEKAHRSLQDIFLQVLDKGSLRDGEGRDVDFRNTIVLMTSNTGSRTIHALCADPATVPDGEALEQALRPELLEVFNAPFIGRVSVVPYRPLDDAAILGIIGLALERARARVTEAWQAEMTWDEAVPQAIAARCRETETGARNIEHILGRNLLPEIASEFLGRMATGDVVRSVHVATGENGRFAVQVA